MMSLALMGRSLASGLGASGEPAAADGFSDALAEQLNPASSTAVGVSKRQNAAASLSNASAQAPSAALSKDQTEKTQATPLSNLEALDAEQQEASDSDLSRWHTRSGAQSNTQKNTQTLIGSASAVGTLLPEVDESQTPVVPGLPLASKGAEQAAATKQQPQATLAEQIEDLANEDVEGEHSTLLGYLDQAISLGKKMQASLESPKKLGEWSPNTGNAVLSAGSQGSQSELGQGPEGSSFASHNLLEKTFSSEQRENTKTLSRALVLEAKSESVSFLKADNKSSQLLEDASSLENAARTIVDGALETKSPENKAQGVKAQDLLVLGEQKSLKSEQPVSMVIESATRTVTTDRQAIEGTGESLKADPATKVPALEVQAASALKSANEKVLGKGVASDAAKVVSELAKTDTSKVASDKTAVLESSFTLVKGEDSTALLSPLALSEGATPFTQASSALMGEASEGEQANTLTKRFIADDAEELKHTKLGGSESVNSQNVLSASQEISKAVGAETLTASPSKGQTDSKTTLEDALKQSKSAELSQGASEQKNETDSSGERNFSQAQQALLNEQTIRHERVQATQNFQDFLKATGQEKVAQGRESLQTFHSSVQRQSDVLGQKLNLIHPEASVQLKEQMVMMVRDNVQMAEIRLDPADLGAMHVKLSMQQDQLAVQFVVQTSQTRDLMEQQMPRLRELLQQQGIELSQGSVQQEQNSGRQASDGSSAGRGSANADSDAQAALGEEMESVQIQTKVSERVVDYYA